MKLKALILLFFVTSIHKSYGQFTYDEYIADLMDQKNISSVRIQEYNIKSDTLNKQSESKFRFDSLGRIFFSSKETSYSFTSDSVIYDKKGNYKTIYKSREKNKLHEKIDVIYDNKNEIELINYYLYTAPNQNTLYNNISLSKKIENDEITTKYFDVKSGIQQEFHFNKQGLLVKEVKQQKAYLYYSHFEYEYANIESSSPSDHVFENICVLQTNRFYIDVLNGRNAYTKRKDLLGKVKRFGEKGKLMETYHYKYDEKGNLIEEITEKTSEDDTIKRTISIYKLDKHNSMIQEKYIFPNGRSKVYNLEYEYTYDNNNNWIKRVEYRGGEKREVIEREIKYKEN